MAGPGLHGIKKCNVMPIKVLEGSVHGNLGAGLGLGVSGARSEARKGTPGASKRERGKTGLFGKSSKQQRECERWEIGR